MTYFQGILFTVIILQNNIFEDNIFHMAYCLSFFIWEQVRQFDRWATLFTELTARRTFCTLTLFAINRQ